MLEAPAFDASRRRLAWLLLALVVLGAALRFHHISRNSLWADELFTLRVALYHPLVPAEGVPWYRPINISDISDSDTFLTVKLGEQSPPLHDLLAKASVHLLGPTELAARLPAAIAACALLLACAFLAWRTSDRSFRRILCWTLLLLAFWPALVVWAKEGRAYGLGVSLVGIGALLWVSRWRAGPQAWRPIGWAEVVSFACASLAHYSAMVMVFLLVLPDVVMTVRRRSPGSAARLFALAVPVCLWVGFHVRTILFTLDGGVTWGSRATSRMVQDTLFGAVTALHPPWLAAGAILLAGLAGFSSERRPAGEAGLAALVREPQVARGLVLVAMVVAYIAIAGVIVGRAGMWSPRYYIFAIPLVAILLAAILAEYRGPWVAGLFAAALVALAVPFLRSPLLMAGEDFRAMTRYAVQGDSSDTVYLHPWTPNRDIYRVYLDRMTGVDNRRRMVGTGMGEPGYAAATCDRLADAPHVAVLSQLPSKDSIDAVYAACGARWPHRYRQHYWLTFGEHWFKHKPALEPSR